MTQQSLFRDTIFALSSGSLPAGVAVIRLSGPHVRDVLETAAGGVPAARSAELRWITTASGDRLDRGLVLFFSAPRSFTGEDCAELHLHGGKAVVHAVLSLLGSLTGCRQAEAGEFTRRAFLNGKVDLTAAEALGDLVVAETEAQRRLALENSSGRQHELYASWRARLLHARAMIEAELDFADEGDVPGSVAEAVWADMALLEREIETHLAGFKAAEIIRTGFRVVLLGPPNAGKSSLLNALAGRDVAIVTEVPGTTRDLVEVALDIDGLKILLTDTAGLREAVDIVERIGVERARAAAQRADLVIELVDDNGDGRYDAGLPGTPRLRVASKSDLGVATGNADLSVSAMTGAGLSDLLAEIGRLAGEATNADGQAIPSRTRHVEGLKTGMKHIRNARAGGHDGLELRAEELRLASSALGRIIGETGVEDVLGAIFANFCIGK